MSKQWKPHPVLYLIPIMILGILIGFGIKSGFYNVSGISAGTLIWVMGAYIHRFLPNSRRYGQYSTAAYMIFIFIGFAVIIWSLTLQYNVFAPGPVVYV